MNTDVKLTIHNRFDVYSTDTETGKTKQVAFAENIVLNNMWSRLCNFSTFWDCIAYGTGTGTLAPTRTALFTHLGAKATTINARTTVLPTVSLNLKIILNPEDNVGATITELGLAGDTGTASLLTHAMLKDMNGNIVSITKTSTEILTIYATVYTTLSCPENVTIPGGATNNIMIAYFTGTLLDNGWYYGNFYFDMGECNEAGEVATVGAHTSIGSSPEFATRTTIDVANKRVTSAVVRVPVDSCNGNIAEMALCMDRRGWFTDVCRIRFPATNIYPGLPLSNIPIGTGDGVKKRFTTPSRNVKEETLTVYKDGIAVSDAEYSKIIGDYVMESKNIFYAATSPRAVNYARNVPVVAIARDITPYIYTADFVNSVVVKRADPAVLPTGSVADCALSDDGSVLVVCHASSPYITTYDWSGSAWIKRADPAILPTGACTDIALSGNGMVLVVGHASSPYITTYDWVDTAWIKRANPAVLPTSACTDLALSQNGLILAVSHTASPFVTAYDWTGTAWIKRTNPTTLPTGAGYCCALSDSGSVLAVGHETSPFVTTYDWVDTAWVKRTNPTPLPLLPYKCCSLSGDGTLLSGSTDYRPCDSVNYYNLYAFYEGVWYEGTHGNRLGGLYSSVAYSYITPDKKYLIQVLYGDLRFYKLDSCYEQIVFTTPPDNGAVITADYTVDGIHKTNQRVLDLSVTITFGEPS